MTRNQVPQKIFLYQCVWYREKYSFLRYRKLLVLGAMAQRNDAQLGRKHFLPRVHPPHQLYDNQELQTQKHQNADFPKAILLE